MQLSEIKSPENLKSLSAQALKELAKSLRDYIIDIISKNEGHLGAGLGVIELTLMLHKVFNTPKDIIIWDVGHQAYAHKILTGRYDAFQKIRQYGAISGFPKREESPYDAFGTGHASTAISATLGMALAHKIQGIKGIHHIAVVGDASIAGGMALEAINHLGTTDANVLIILNDNTMGIDPSTGALKNYFEKVKVNQHTENNIFQSLNLTYSGPIDGHDLTVLEEHLEAQRQLKGPRMLHIVTTKGKGLPSAESDQVRFHAPGKFDPITGKINKISSSKNLKYQEVFGNTLTELARQNEKIVAITPAMPSGSGLNKMMEAFPHRCFDVGIAEQHAVTLAAGMAAKGLIPYCTIYSTFLQRAYDQIIHDVALQKLPVVFCVDRAGLVGHDGPTHHGVFDMAFLRCIPNLIMSVPKDAFSFRNVLYSAQFVTQPIAIRYPRAYSSIHEDQMPPFKKIAIGRGTELKKGTTTAVISVGTLADNVQKAIAQCTEPEKFGHFDLGFVKPLDESLLQHIFSSYENAIVIEESVEQGGAGSAILEFAYVQEVSIPIQLHGIKDAFVPHGSMNELYDHCGFSVPKLSQLFNAVLKKSTRLRNQSQKVF